MAAVAEVHVLVPTGLSGLPMLPNDLFGASRRHYERGTLTGAEGVDHTRVASRR